MEKELDLFNFDESFVARKVATGKDFHTSVDDKGRIRTFWGGKSDKIYK